MKSSRFLLHTISFVVLALGFFSLPATGEQGTLPWDLSSLNAAPKTWPAPDFAEEGVKALFYEGPRFEGRDTRVFAWYGVPKREGNEKVPAMVLVHGGGGTAFAAWVRLWTSRGYAAIAMDTCGCVPKGEYNKWERHEWGGPAGWGGFEKVDAPLQDQWPYQAVAEVVLAHSLIRSFPEVDPERTGLTGISWGGYLTCIVAGVDPRFKLAVPVYGCGFLGEGSVLLDVFQKMGKDKAVKWLGLWDPSVYLSRAAMPMLWVTGTNDFAFPMDLLQKSYRLPTGPRTLCVRPRMPHGHGGPGENPEEIHALADNLLRGGVPLGSITGRGRDGNRAWVTFSSPKPIVKAELEFTKATGTWKDRLWEVAPAELSPEGGKVSAVLPEGCTVYYFNLVDDRDLVVSSEHEEMVPKAR